MKIIFNGLGEFGTPLDLDLHVTDLAGFDEEHVVSLQEEDSTPSVPAPVANADAAAVVVGNEVTINVLSNDVPAGQVGFDGIVAPPGGGTAVHLGGGLVRYTANGTAGDDVFTYSVSNASGSAVGTVTITKVPAQTGGGGALQITMKNPSTGVAPYGSMFSATVADAAVGDTFFDYEYFWTFGDPGSYTRHDRPDIVQRRVYDVDGTLFVVRGPVCYYASDGITPHATPATLQAIPGHTEPGTGNPVYAWTPNHGSVRTYLGPDKNSAKGPHTTHVFADPGVYVVTCWAVKPGFAPLKETLTVTVQDPEAVFAPLDTYCVSPDNNFTGAPAGSRTYTTFANAYAAAGAASDGTVRRILFRRGRSHGMPDPNGSSKLKENHAILHIGAFGAGTPPLLTNGFKLKSSVTQQYAIHGLNFKNSNYESSDPWGTVPSGSTLEIFGTSPKTIWDCGFESANVFVLILPNSRGLTIGNCHFTKWHHYGLYSNHHAGYTGLCGVFARADVDTVCGPVKDETTPPYYVDHNGFRFSALGDPLCMSMCDSRQIGTWAGDGRTYFQPCYRIGRSSSYEGPQYEEAVLDSCSGIHGSQWGTGDADTVRSEPRRYLWDSCINAQQRNGEIVFTLGVLGPRHRNNLAIVLDVDIYTAGNASEWWCGRPTDGKADDIAAMSDFGVAIYNNTLVNQSVTPHDFDTDILQNGGTGAGGSLKRPADFVRVGNNIVVSPAGGYDSGDDVGGFLDKTLVTIDEFPGVRFQSTTVQSGYAVPPGSIALYFPKAGSPAIGRASTTYSNIGNGEGAPRAVFDLFDNPRGAVTASGAIRGPGETLSLLAFLEG